jgi:hypothetical protein
VFLWKELDVFINLLINLMFQRSVLYTTSYKTLTPIPVAVWFRRRSAAARLLGSRVRIPLRVCMFVSRECCMFCT